MMSIPGLALFYGGLVRAKNMLSVLMQVFTIVCVAALVWVCWGYSMAFTSGGRQRLRRRLRQGVPEGRVDATTLRGDFSNGVYIPEYVFSAFQMTFACITPALIVGAFAERIKFSPLILFVVAVADARLFPDRAHGLVLGRPGLLHAAKAGEAHRCQDRGEAA